MHSPALSPSLLWLTLCSISLIVFFLLFFPDRLHELHVHWTTSGDLDMGYPLLAITAYFCFRASKEINEMSLDYRFIPFLLSLSLLLLISSILDIKTLFFMILSLTFPVFFASVMGFQAARRLLLPLLITGMAMPFWYLAIAPLQKMTVIAVSFLAESLQLTVLIEGNYFTVPSGVVHVAGGCSGLKYFLSGLTISLISSAMSKRALKLTIISLVLAAVLAIIGNWIRVFILLLIGYYEGVSHPLMADHDTLGWFVFAGVMLPWFLIDNKLEKAAGNHASTEPHTHKASGIQEINHRKIATAFILCMLVLALPMNFKSNAGEISFTEKTLTVPDSLAGFTLNSYTPARHELNYPTPNLEFSGQYRSETNDRIEIHVLSYHLHGKVELANTTNSIFKPNQWLLISDKAYQFRDKTDLNVRVAIAKQGNLKRLVYYWYKHGDTMANSILQSKKAQLLSTFSGDHIAHLVAISKDCLYDCSELDQIEPELIALIETLQQEVSIK